MDRAYSFLLAAAVIQLINCSPLSEYISSYETLSYSREQLQTQHARSKRSTFDRTISLDLQAFGRTLSLVLHPDVGTFHSSAVIEVDGKEEPLSGNHLYKGFVKGEPKSSVVGSIIGGLFQGVIKLKGGEEFHIERKEHYKGNEDLARDEAAHSVIYRRSDVDVDGFYNKLKKRSSDQEKLGTCGNSLEQNVRWMKEIQRSAVHEKASMEPFYHEEGDNPYVRKKRASTGKTTCNLFLQADPTLWGYFKSLFGSSAGDDMIKEEITNLFNQHVSEVNSIYTTTAFRDTTTGRFFRNIGFRVDRVLINKTCDATTDHPFCSTNIDASNLLNLNSYRDHSAYCTAFVFSYRDFDGGTLGLAWVAEPGTNKGGICSEFTTFAESGGTRKKSLNTGIVTLLNYNKRIPILVSQITFAHELGHNFGSQHDPSSDARKCTPQTDSDDSKGNYIMFASATTGTKVNNNHFSNCSIGSIAAVLVSVNDEKNGHRNCFQESAGQWCGNQIFEGNEQCDCGYASDCVGKQFCCQCCNGQSDTNNDPNACTRKQIAQCDPSEGPCCTRTCGFVSNAVNLTCRVRTECAMAAQCSGTRASCPASTPMPNGIPCNENTQICNNGTCTGSICSLVTTSGQTWEPCSPSRDQNDPTSLCYIACKMPGNGSVCYSSANVNSGVFPAEFKSVLNRTSGGPIKLPAGHTCDRDTGFCDHFQKCRAVNAQGPLSRLKDLLFSASALENAKAILTQYWWAVALGIIGLILLMVGFVKFCAVHTPSSNPKKPAARKLSQTLTLKRRQARTQGQPPAAQQRGSQLPPPYTRERIDHIQEIPSTDPSRSRQQGAASASQAAKKSQAYEMQRQGKPAK